TLLLAPQGQLGELRDLALEARQLRADDQDVDQHGEEDHEVGRGDVFLLGRHESASRSSRRRMSSRVPESSTRQSAPASEISAARATMNVANCEVAICGPLSVNVVGWMNCSESRIARKLIGIRTTPNNA